MNQLTGKQLAAQQDLIEDLTLAKIRRKLAKIYATHKRRVVREYMDALNDIKTRATGEQLTLTDIYKSPRYWQAQQAISEDMQAFTEQQQQAINEALEDNYRDIAVNLAALLGVAVALKPGQAANAVNSVWCADGRTWAERIAANTAEMQQKLQQEFTTAVTAGRTQKQTREALHEPMQQAYNAAEKVANTEAAHATATAAHTVYEELNAIMLMIVTEKDSRTCSECYSLEGRKYELDEQLPIPAHPNCRCRIVPVQVV